jgi:hypothetical protein
MGIGWRDGGDGLQREPANDHRGDENYDPAYDPNYDDEGRPMGQCCDCGVNLSVDDPEPLKGEDPRCKQCEKEAREEWANEER